MLLQYCNVRLALANGALLPAKLIHFQITAICFQRVINLKVKAKAMEPNDTGM